MNRRRTSVLAATAAVALVGVSVWSLASDQGADVFLLALAGALVLGLLAWWEWPGPMRVSTSAAADPPADGALPLDGDGSFELGSPNDPISVGDPATAEADLADLRAAVHLLQTCTPHERRRIEAANEPIGVEDIADILQGPGIDNYLEARAAWEGNGHLGPQPGVDPDLAAAARDVLALADRGR